MRGSAGGLWSLFPCGRVLFLVQNPPKSKAREPAGVLWCVVGFPLERPPLPWVLCKEIDCCTIGPRNTSMTLTWIQSLKVEQKSCHRWDCIALWTRTGNMPEWPISTNVWTHLGKFEVWLPRPFGEGHWRRGGHLRTRIKTRAALLKREIVQGVFYTGPPLKS